MISQRCSEWKTIPGFLSLFELLFLNLLKQLVSPSIVTSLNARDVFWGWVGHGQNSNAGIKAGLFPLATVPPEVIFSLRHISVIIMEIKKDTEGGSPGSMELPESVNNHSTSMRFSVTSSCFTIWHYLTFWLFVDFASPFYKVCNTTEKKKKEEFSIQSVCFLQNFVCGAW